MIITNMIDVKKEVIIGVQCNLCGKSLEPTIRYETYGQFEFAILQANWGYDSKHDMETFQLEFCEDCVYNKILPMMKIQPEIKESM